MKLSTQRGRGSKIHLLLDDVYTVTTDVAFWNDHYVPDDTEVTEETWDALLAAILQRKAEQKAIDLLSRREHSKKELIQKLARSFGRQSAEQAAATMEQMGYLDEERYTRFMLEHLLKDKKFSLSRAKRELALRGISDDLLELVLQETELADPVEQITDLLASKYQRKLLDEKGRRQTVSALQRLGYSYSDIRSAFYRYQTEIDEYEE